MNLPNPFFELCKKIITTWVNTQDTIRSIIVVGSQVRSDHPADEWSDLDLQVFCTDYQHYLSNTTWLEGIGKIWICLPFQQAHQEAELLVVFDGGHKVDFHFFDVAELQKMVETQTLGEVYQRGYECLVDKDDRVRKLPPTSKKHLEKTPPIESEFRRVIELFWYEALFIAKMIRRRELWSVKAGDCMGPKQRLLQMLEWHAQVKHGWKYDTWYGGKNLKDWEEPGIMEKLTQLFSHFDAADSWKGLLETMSVFELVASETARDLGYPYPLEMGREIKGLIERLHVEDERLQGNY